MTLDWYMIELIFFFPINIYYTGMIRSLENIIDEENNNVEIHLFIKILSLSPPILY